MDIIYECHDNNIKFEHICKFTNNVRETLVSPHCIVLERQLLSPQHSVII